MATCHASRLAMNALQTARRPRLTISSPINCRFKNKWADFAKVRVPDKAPQTREKIIPGRPTFDLKTRPSLDALPLQVVEKVVNDRKDAFDLMSAHEYYEQLGKFVDFIVSRGSLMIAFPPTKGLPSAQVLHDLGCIAAEGTRGGSWPLFVPLWYTAANWGFTPSLATLVSYLRISGGLGKIPQLTDIENRFKAQVRKGTDPLVLAVQGDILHSQGKYAEAERILRDVLEKHDASGLGGWEPNCRLTLGRALAAQDKTEEGLAILQELSDDGYVQADMHLGQLLIKIDEDEALKYLFKAACMGTLPAYVDMAIIHAKRAARAKDQAEAAENKRWESEFLRLADPKSQI